MIFWTIAASRRTKFHFHPMQCMGGSNPSEVDALKIAYILSPEPIVNQVGEGRSTFTNAYNISPGEIAYKVDAGALEIFRIWNLLRHCCHKSGTVSTILFFNWKHCVLFFQFAGLKDIHWGIFYHEYIWHYSHQNEGKREIRNTLIALWVSFRAISYKVIPFIDPPKHIISIFRPPS